jgi:hypothetical protein
MEMGMEIINLIFRIFNPPNQNTCLPTGSVYGFQGWPGLLTLTVFKKAS